MKSRGADGGGPLDGDHPLVVAHHHPGRLRVRSRAFEWDPRLRESIAEWLAAEPGVRAVQSHGPTGGILVEYDPSATDAGRLLLAIAARAHLQVAEPDRRAPAQRVYDAAHALDDHVLELTGGRFGLGIVMPVALGLGSIASFVWSPHPRAPRWDNLLYWGVQAFRWLNEDERARRRSDASG